MNLNFHDRFLENIQMQSFIKIFPVEAKFFCADKERNEQTDFRKVIVAFRSIADAPKNAGCNAVQETIALQAGELKSEIRSLFRGKVKLMTTLT